MKDIYELLNEANIDVTKIDVDKIEEMEVSELEKVRGKKKLMESIKATPKGGQNQKQNSGRLSKKIAMVASLVIIIGTSSIVVVKPVWAVNLPIIGNLIQRDLIDVNSKYKDYIQVVGETKSDQGIDITFESAVADNNILNLSFIVKNNNERIDGEFNDIGEAMMIPTTLKVNGERVSTASGANHEFIDENTIRILKKISWDYNELPNKLNMDIEISNIFGKIGNWDVNFTLDVREVRKQTYVENLDRVIDVDGSDVNLTKLVMTPFTTNIKSFSNYKGEVAAEIRFIIIDNDGKVLKTGGRSGRGDLNMKTLNISDNYINNPNTKTLNMIPYYLKYGNVNSKDKEEKLPPTNINIDNFSKVNLKVNEDMSIDINNCIVEGEYLVVKYSYRYLDVSMTDIISAQIYIDADGEDVSGLNSDSDEDIKEISRLYNKYYDSKRENKVEIVKIGNVKNIEIGCYDGSSVVVLKDQAFTVTKK